MKVVVTGGLGYVGGAVCMELLLRGHEVMALDDLSSAVAAEVVPSRNWQQGKIEDDRVGYRVKCFSPDVAVLLAARASALYCDEHPVGAAMVNIGAFESFVRMALRSTVRAFVHVGSCAVYGNSGSVRLAETLPTVPVSVYGWTKLVAERILSSACAEAGRRRILLRLFNVAGAAHGIHEGAEHNGRIVPSALRAAVDGVPLLSRGHGRSTASGYCERDYIHLADAAEAIATACEASLDGPSRLDGAVLNIGTGIASSVADVAAEAGRAAGGRCRIGHSEPYALDPDRCVADPSEAVRLLGWKAKRSLRDAVESAAAAMGAHVAAPARP